MKTNIVYSVRRVSLAAAVSLLAIASTPASAADDSLFLELGGLQGVTKLAQYHVQSMLADSRISAKFVHTNVEHLQQMTADLLCVVTGVPCEYKGRALAEAHQNLDLHNSDFNAVTEDLIGAMNKAGIPFRAQNRLLARVAPAQHDVVTK